ncbi:MAG: GAF domain-containing protein [Cryomorphaceae bacterium]
MAESIYIETGAPKEIKYQQILPQIEALIEGEEDQVAALANVAAALHQPFQHLWTGFYFVRNRDLKLGPFQGPVACMTIAFGKGVCGRCWKEEEAIVVPDVDRFPGHISCNNESRSEIVVPIKTKDGKVIAVLDIDSAQLNAFDAIDRQYLQQLCEYLGKTIF